MSSPKPAQDVLELDREAAIFESLAYFLEFMDYLEARGYKAQRDYIKKHCHIRGDLIVIQHSANSNSEEAI